jgi:hypothetical protein
MTSPTRDLLRVVAADVLAGETQPRVVVGALE